MTNACKSEGALPTNQPEYMAEYYAEKREYFRKWHEQRKNGEAWTTLMRQRKQDRAKAKADRFNIDVPYMAIQGFARHLRLPRQTIRDWFKEGYSPDSPFRCDGVNKCERAFTEGMAEVVLAALKVCPPKDPRFYVMVNEGWEALPEVVRLRERQKAAGSL